MHGRLFLAIGLLAGLVLRPAQAQTVDAIRAAGHLACGAITAEDDWNAEDLHGDLSRLGGEICRAVALAVLGGQAKLEVVAFPAEPEALEALRSGRIQLVVGVSPGAEVATRYGVAFGPPVFYDALRLMVVAESRFKTAADLRDQLICVMENTPAQRTLQDEMAARGITFGMQAHSEQGEMGASIGVAHCQAGAALETRLADLRADFPANAAPFRFLPERFGLAPVVPAYRYGDQRFGLIVEATVNALVEAEALGITQANVAEAQARTDMRARRLLGADRTLAQALGLPPDWAVPVIAATGNYGEIFARTVAEPFQLERGLNALWTAGGLIHPSPLQ